MSFASSSPALASTSSPHACRATARRMPGLGLDGGDQGIDGLLVDVASWV